MSAKHTQGRLTVRENGDANSYALVDDTGNWLLSLLHNGQQLTETQRENLRRLAACWNACEGLHTESLERGAPLADQIVDALNQRDELLAHLEIVAFHLRRRDFEQGGSLADEALDKIEATIAKVKGPAS